MVEINKKKCIGCAMCVKDCISRSLYMEEGKSCYTGNCLLCGHCVAICPVNAFTIPQLDMDDVAEIHQPADSAFAGELMNMIKSRRSIRSYKEKAIEPEKLASLIDAGRYTATASNLQENRFIIVQDKLAAFKEIIWRDLEQAVDESREEAARLRQLVILRRESGIDYLFRNAPAVIFIATANVWDAGLAAQNMELTAVSQGLGMLYNGFLIRATQLSNDAKDFLKTGDKPLAACMLAGYPALKYRRTAPRKEADVVLL